MKIKDELDNFRDYLFERDHISLILKLHLNIEQYMDLVIERTAPIPEKILSFKFRDKVYILNSFGIINNNIQKHLLEFNNLRNRFSHKFKYVLNSTDLDMLKKIYNYEEPYIPDSIKDDLNLVSMPIISKAGGFLAGYLGVLGEIVKKIEFEYFISKEKLEKTTGMWGEWQSEIKKNL